MPTPRQELSRHYPALIASVCGIMLGVGALPVYILGPLSAAFQAELGWQPADMVTALSFLSAGLALGLPIAGRLSDRIHVRPLALAALVILAALFAVVPTAARLGLWYFRAVYFCMGLLTAGTVGLFYTRAVSSCFEAARGLALGITLAGSGITSFLAPFLVHAIERWADWPFVFYGIAAAILVIGLPVIAMGLRDVPPPHADDRERPPSEGADTLAAVLRDPRLYLLVVSLVLHGLVIGGLLVDTVPALIDKGIDPAQAIEIASLLGISLIVGRVGCGWLLDRVPASYVAIGAFLVGAAGCYLFTGSNMAMTVIGVIAIGALNGAEIDLISFMVARYFGLRLYGRVYSILYTCYVLTAIVGPFFCGALIRHGGHALFYMTAGAAYVAAALCMVALSRVEDGPSGASRPSRMDAARLE